MIPHFWGIRLLRQCVTEGRFKKVLLQISTSECYFRVILQSVRVLVQSVRVLLQSVTSECYFRVLLQSVNSECYFWVLLLSVTSECYFSIYLALLKKILSKVQLSMYLIMNDRIYFWGVNKRTCGDGVVWPGADEAS